MPYERARQHRMRKREGIVLILGHDGQDTSEDELLRVELAALPNEEFHLDLIGFDAGSAWDSGELRLLVSCNGIRC